MGWGEVGDGMVGWMESQPSYASRRGAQGGAARRRPLPPRTGVPAAAPLPSPPAPPAVRRTVDVRGVSVPHAGGDLIVNTTSPLAVPVKFHAAGDTWVRHPRGGQVTGAAEEGAAAGRAGGAAAATLARARERKARDPEEQRAASRLLDSGA